MLLCIETIWQQLVNKYGGKKGLRYGINIWNSLVLAYRPEAVCRANYQAARNT